MRALDLKKSTKHGNFLDLTREFMNIFKLDLIFLFEENQVKFENICKSLSQV